MSALANRPFVKMNGIGNEIVVVDLRSGAPATYTPEQICAVIAMTCEKPSESERPISHWSQREIADEAIRRGLVSNISQRSVGRFLKKRPTLNRTAFVTG